MPSVGYDVMVTLPTDRPGTLATAATAIAEAGVNLDGAAEIEGQFHVLFADRDRATPAHMALEAAGFDCLAPLEVTVTECEDQPGALARVLGLVADAGINVRFCYLATGARVVIGGGRTADVMAALSA